MKRAACALVAASIGSLAALGLWSWWWPHTDVRQLWATTGMAIAVAGIAVSAQRCWQADSEFSMRMRLLQLGIGALIGGAALLTWLIVTTAPHR